MHIENKSAADDNAAVGSIDPPAPPPSVPMDRSKRSWTPHVALAALLLGVAGITAGYFTARQFNTLQQSQVQRTQELQAALDSVGKRQDELAEHLARVESALPDVAEEMAEVEELLRRAAEQRVEPADIERLLRMANDSLQLEGDSDTALRALRNADQRLQALGDPLFAEVRRRLAQEITALAAVPRPDIAGMAYSLSSLQGELGSLFIKREAPVRLGEGAPEAGADRSELPRWRVLLQDMWVTLKSLVVVRHREGSELPLIMPGEQIFLTQNLHITLEAARLALFSRDDRNFHASLKTAQTWLRDYYDNGSAAVAAVSARLGEMDRVDIAPPLPDISASLHALQAALERRRGAAREGVARTPANGPAPKGRATAEDGGT